MKTKLTILILLLSLTYKVNAQFERGSEPGEIYLTTNWYNDWATDTGYIMLIHSEDYGRTFTISNIEGWYLLPSSGPYQKYYPDAANDTLYQKWGDTLKISYDNGYTWQNQIDDFGISSKLATGSVKGHVYKYDGSIYKSTDYGESFSFINDNISSWRFGAGVSEESLYWYRILDNPTTFYIYHSFDSGLNFDSVAVSEDIVGGGDWEVILVNFHEELLRENSIY